MKKHIKIMTRGIIGVLVCVNIALFAWATVWMFSVIPQENGHVAILDFFAATVGILLSLASVYFVGLKLKKTTSDSAPATDEEGGACDG